MKSRTGSDVWRSGTEVVPETTAEPTANEGRSTALVVAGYAFGHDWTRERLAEALDALGLLPERTP